MISYPPEYGDDGMLRHREPGGALYNGKFFRTILDGRVQALDIKKNREEIWNVRSSTTAEGYAMTGAPLVANGVVIVGVAERVQLSRLYRGLRRGDGNRLWRLYNVPRPASGAPETWPNQAAMRPGEALGRRALRSRSRSRLLGHGQPLAPQRARSLGRQSVYGQHSGDPAKSGQMVWHYQTSPNDPSTTTTCSP